jgi:hypothetical protein
VTGSEAAWGWVAHLSDGGTTPWADWSGTAPSRGPVPPGAQQLELLRRLNLAGRPGTDLVAGVLAADPPRRSRPALPLLGDPGVSAHGPRPVDPGTLGDGELARLAAVLLAQRLAAQSLPEPPRPGRVRPWRVRYHLHGDPELVVPLRRHLVARGRPPGGHDARAVVLGTDVGRMLADLWTAQSLRNGAPPWHEWLAASARTDRLPEPLELGRIARREAELHGAHRVHVVTDPSLAPRLLGVRRGPRAAGLSTAGADLGRRVVSALRPMAGPRRRARLTGEVLRPWLAVDDGPALLVPERHRDWLERQAERVADELTRGRYPVHGDPALVRPADRPGTGVVDSSQTLALAVRLLLEKAEEAP